MTTEKLEKGDSRIRDFAIDPLLLLICNMVDKIDNFSFSITFLVDGCVVYGELISKSKYFSETRKMLSTVENG